MEVENQIEKMQIERMVNKLDQPHQKGMGMDKLFDDVLDYSLSYLDAANLYIVTRVCKRWTSLAEKRGELMMKFKLNMHNWQILHDEYSFFGPVFLGLGLHWRFLIFPRGMDAMEKKHASSAPLISTRSTNVTVNMAQMASGIESPTHQGQVAVNAGPRSRSFLNVIEGDRRHEEAMANEADTNNAAGRTVHIGNTTSPSSSGTNTFLSLFLDLADLPYSAFELPSSLKNKNLCFKFSLSVTNQDGSLKKVREDHHKFELGRHRDRGWRYMASESELRKHYVKDDAVSIEVTLEKCRDKMCNINSKHIVGSQTQHQTQPQTTTTPSTPLSPPEQPIVPAITLPADTQNNSGSNNNDNDDDIKNDDTNDSGSYDGDGDSGDDADDKWGESNSGDDADADTDGEIEKETTV